ncbi:P68 family surface lipoprotein [Mycoplasmopsis cricetuli]|uniref:P68 family surface lipoprotein n=1 Tax=Mycoplasmopsis cricetuli TaxID=171283 RepID=UPI0004702559|nr:P80 family lipoprotein [Mycoplasmopsis cricetuli]
MTSKLKKFILISSLPLIGGVTTLAAGCSSDDSDTELISSPGDTPEQRRENAEHGANPAGISNRFDTEYDESREIKIGTTFSKGGIQAKTIDNILAVYNKLVDDKSADLFKGYKKVEQKNLGSGYPAGATKLQQDLNLKNKSEFYNLIVNYSNVASILADKNMLLSFNDITDDTNFDISEFSDLFTKSNSLIENVTNGSTYVLPLAKSTNILSLNAPVLSYIISKMKEVGATIASDEKTTSFIKDLEDKGKDDREEVQKLWGLARSGQSLQGYTISKSIFENYDKMIEFSNKAQTLLTNSYNEGNPSSSELHVFGIDWPASLLLQASYSDLDAIDKNALTKVVPKNGKEQADFDTIKNKDSLGSLSASKIYNVLKEAIKLGSIKLQPGGAYSSGNQTKHKFAFSIGSTAGYSHNFVKAGKNQSDFTFDNTLVVEYDLDENKGKFLTVKNGASFDAKDKNKVKDTDQVLFSFSKFNNFVYKSTYSGSGFSSFNVKSKDAKNDEKINSILNKITEKSLLIKIPDFSETKSEFKKLIVNLDKKSIVHFVVQSSDEKESLVIFFEDGITKKEAKDNKKETNEINELSKNKLIEIGFKYNEYNEKGLLQENELVILDQPLKWNEKNKKKVIYLQGPSLIGIHNNEKDDQATKAFVKWLFTSKTEYEFDSPDKSENEKKKNSETGKEESVPKKVKLAPIIFLQKYSSYLTPIKGFESIDEKLFDKKSDKNAYIKNTLKLFKLAHNNKDEYVMYEEPGSTKSNPFRESVQTGLISLQDNPDDQTFEKFVANIKLT